jgi:Secretion system C-terminal sorting domain
MWPLPENLAYNNVAYQTAAMGGLPLGDLNWWPDKLAAWEAQKDDEWALINSWLVNGGPTSIQEIPGTLPSEFGLEQNYPNPFNPTTKIRYSIPQSNQVSLKIYNSLGQEVASIFEGYQQAGSYIAEFDAANLASGVYMYQLRSENVLLTKKFVLMK